MNEILRISISIFILISGVFLGKSLKKIAIKEIKQGQIYFRILVIASLIGGLISLIMKNDILMFTFFFIAIVTSQSLKKSKD